MQFVTDSEIYRKVILDAVNTAKSFLWIASSDIKDLYVRKGARMVPFLEVLSNLIDRRVAIRLLHAKEPGEAFRRDFDRYPNLIQGLERVICPRVHFKCVVVDGRTAYTGSANLTGAGMGAKSDRRRNFESGFVTEDADIIKAIMEQFDTIWRGERCSRCERKQYCADYKDLLGEI
jgi:phosphatidylserine/phosphatidylglycerophosphate/cardiolipin synthase-like enzyme